MRRDVSLLLQAEPSAPGEMELLQHIYLREVGEVERCPSVWRALSREQGPDPAWGVRRGLSASPSVG